MENHVPYDEDLAQFFADILRETNEDNQIESIDSISNDGIPRISSEIIPRPSTFLERERHRKMMYRRKIKDEVSQLHETCIRLQAHRDHLIQKRERRLKQTEAERQAIHEWALMVERMREHNIGILQYNSSLRDSIRQQILMAMSYQRTARHALHHMNISLAHGERRNEIFRILNEQKHQLNDIRLKWNGLLENDDTCTVTFNAAQTDIARADILRCRRFPNSNTSDVANQVWMQLTGDTTHSYSAPRIAQRLDTIDPTTYFTRVYMCDDVAPFGLNVVQHRQDFDDKHLIMYRTVDFQTEECFQDMIKWNVVCWLEVLSDGSDTLVKEHICYTQVGEQAILPALLGCESEENTPTGTKQEKLQAWMKQVVSKLYSGCKVIPK